jgi:AcrR family transcriptional regulator
MPSFISSKPWVVPRAGLSPARVVDEAAQLVDQVGRERLTLSELAKRLGVAQPSLYKHVEGLDGLNRQLTILALSEIGATMRRASTGQAREDAICALANAYRTYALNHPGRYGYVLRAPTPDDAAWEAAAAEILSILDDVFTGYGITGADAVDAARFVRSVLHGFVSL